MAASDFPRSLKLVLIDEGGLDDDPNDHGGRTAHGITQSEYDPWRRRKGLQTQDVWKITPEELSEIYHDQYWEPWSDKLSAGMDYTYFDFKTNAGQMQATKTLQRVLGVDPDGHMGEITLEAALKADQPKLIKDYCAARREFYRHLAQFPRYGRGWIARTDHVEHASLEIEATGEAVRRGLSDELRAQATARANPDDTAQPTVSSQTSGAASAGSGIIASVVQKLHEITDPLQAFQGTFQFIEYALAGIAIVSAGFMIYGMVQEAKVKRAIA